MNNIELARFLARCMYQLACMIVWYQRGNTAYAEKYDCDFRETLMALDKLQKDEVSE